MININLTNTDVYGYKVGIFDTLRQATRNVLAVSIQHPFTSKKPGGIDFESIS